MNNSRNGFTLVELLVTLALLSLVAVLSLPYATGGGGAARLGTDARMLAARLRMAREMALASREITGVTIDLSSRSIAGPGGERAYAFAVADRVSVTTARGLAADRSAAILFEPSGGSSGAVVVLEAGAQTRVVRVDWLTGAVSSDVPLR